MVNVFKKAVALVERDEPCVLATVVRTKGMTPQKAGAKQLIQSDGSSVGTLGGGCVEGDIWYYATQMLKKGTGAEFRSYQLNADIAEKDGLICGGTMYFYIEPLRRKEPFLSMAKQILQASETGPQVAVATVIAPQGHAFFGNKLLIRKGAEIGGSLGEKAWDDRAKKLAQELSLFGGNKTFATKDGVEIYVEGFTQPPTLVILGGGHVGKAVYTLALTVGFRVVIIDDRTEFSNKERFPQAHKTIVSAFEHPFQDLELGYNSFIFVATRGHRYDDAATHAAVKTSARYIGLLGSKRKNLLIFKELLKDGVSEERVKAIHAPVGLNIGAVTPEEIAVSVIAEMIQVVRGGDGRPLKMDEREIQQLSLRPS